jgi:hypothetical protein
MRTLHILVLTILVAGCATSPAERAAQAEREVDQMIQVYGPACDKLGYRPESDPWRNCVLQLAAQDDFKRYSRFNSYPTTTQCFGHRGFFNCTTF